MATTRRNFRSLPGGVVFLALLGILFMVPAESSLSEPPGMRQRGPVLPVQHPAQKNGPTPPFVVLGYNELGMHCMNQDFSELCILPPYNNYRAQVIDRTGDDPRIVSKGVTVQYSVPGNTTSVTKTNFWSFALPLFGVNLAPDVGLTGNTLAGVMSPNTDNSNDWKVTGVPLTPMTDAQVLNAYQLGQINVLNNIGQALASTVAVMPVSWEINCGICHTTQGISVATDILRKHDKLHATNLENSKPVLCANCHADPVLGKPGQPGVLALSHAIHLSHADRMKPALKYSSNVCYACHPGYQTQCLRDVHYSHNMTCNNCHGNMKKVGDVNRQPWVDLPTCKHCHQAAHPKDQFEEPGKLFKDSRGHGGVHCAACHGPQHAVMPCVTPPDNQQAINQQGFAGTIQVCTVCHKTKPGDPFFHRIDEGNRPNKQKKPGHTQHQSEKKDPNHEEKTKSDPRHEPGKDKSSTPENSKLIAKGRTEPGKNPLAQAPAAPTDSVLGTYQLTGTERAVLGRKSAVATFSGTLVPLDVGSIQVTKVYTSGRVDRAVVPLAAALNPALASQTVTGVVKSGVLVTTYTFSFTKTARGFTVVGSTAVAELVGNLRLPRAVGEGTFQGSK